MFLARRVLLFVVCTVMVSACKQAGGGGQSEAAEPRSDAQKLGYALGFDMGRSLVQVKDGIDTKALEQGVEEALAEQQPRLSDEQRQQIKVSMLQKLQEKQVADRQALLNKNKEQSEKFLADNAKKPGIKTTASGLQYEVLKEGKGDHPGPQDKVVVNYSGALIDGTVFDSTYDRRQPATLPVLAVIPGWSEGLQLMSPGSKYKFYIPANLAYGDRGASPKIGPNAALVFEVELLTVDKNTAPQVTEPSKAKKS
jgi:FKBP-type peptidyl-prolyl cis-trans isomerase